VTSQYVRSILNRMEEDGEVAYSVTKGGPLVWTLIDARDPVASNRDRVLRALVRMGEATVSELADSIGLTRGIVRHSLIVLKKQRKVTCLTPKQAKNRRWGPLPAGVMIHTVRMQKRKPPKKAPAPSSEETTPKVSNPATSVSARICVSTCFLLLNELDKKGTLTLTKDDDHIQLLRGAVGTYVKNHNGVV
jgi:DNA-binding transcriptional ArsR family regulator